MPWTAIIAIFALLSVQLAITGVSLYAYNRIRSKGDVAGLQMDNWNAKLELAVNTADSANRKAEIIEVQHFKTLRAMFESLSLEVAELKAENKALRAELKTCQTKLASEERMTRRDMAKAARAAKEEPEELGEEGGAPSLADLKARGIAIPLSPEPPAPQQPARSPSFGRPAVR